MIKKLVIILFVVEVRLVSAKFEVNGEFVHLESNARKSASTEANFKPSMTIHEHHILVSEHVSRNTRDVNQVANNIREGQHNSTIPTQEILDAIQYEQVKQDLFGVKRNNNDAITDVNNEYETRARKNFQRVFPQLFNTAKNNKNSPGTVTPPHHVHPTH